MPMTKHDGIRKKLIEALDGFDDGTLKEQILDYISNYEATENEKEMWKSKYNDKIAEHKKDLKAYKELLQDVKRYFDLTKNYIPKENEIGYKLRKEHENLYIKLSKVGNEND
jgi:predicted nucleotide-binding protein (sugar kinase/HSP70/actin superfamily)